MVSRGIAPGLFAALARNPTPEGSVFAGGLGIGSTFGEGILDRDCSTFELAALAWDSAPITAVMDARNRDCLHNDDCENSSEYGEKLHFVWGQKVSDRDLT